MLCKGKKRGKRASNRGKCRGGSRKKGIFALSIRPACYNSPYSPSFFLMLDHLGTVLDVAATPHEFCLEEMAIPGKIGKKFHMF